MLRDGGQSDGTAGSAGDMTSPDEPLGGCLVRGIADESTVADVLTATGGRWCPSTVPAVLQSQAAQEMLPDTADSGVFEDYRP